MGQTWNENTYQIDHTVTTDLQNIETNFETLKSLFSGSSAPSNAVAGMPWFDTSDKVLKIRNQANNGWRSVFYGDATHKIWIYANSAEDGWTVYSTVTDRVLAVKGGSQAYNVSGGSTGGTWTQPSMTLSLTQIPSHGHSVSLNSNGAHTHTTTLYANTTGDGGDSGNWGSADSSSTARTTSSNGSHTHTVNQSNAGSGGSHNHGSTYRPAAAVGTLQYPNA
jgi:hypothetical protein